MDLNVTRGYVAIKLQSAKNEINGIFIVDKGNQQRWGEVVKMGEHNPYIGAPNYKVGNTVLVPNIGGRRIELEDDVFMVFLQSEIMVYATNDEQGISRF